MIWNVRSLLGRPLLNADAEEQKLVPLRKHRPSLEPHLSGSPFGHGNATFNAQIARTNSFLCNSSG